MWYMVHGTDIADSLDRRLAARPAHLERLKQLQNQGRLLLAGPLPAVDSNDPGPAGFSGSLIVAEFDSLEMARAWADTDPLRRRRGVRACRGKTVPKGIAVSASASREQGPRVAGMRPLRVARGAGKNEHADANPHYPLP